MTEYIYKEDATSRLNALVGQVLTYSHKFNNSNIYAFAFGNYVTVTTPEGRRKEVCKLTLHVQCRFKIIKKTGNDCVVTYYEDTPAEDYNLDAKNLLGLRIKRIALSEKNDLWIDMDRYWLVFSTFENDDEAWRFFTPYSDAPHLVASGIDLKLDY